MNVKVLDTSLKRLFNSQNNLSIKVTEKDGLILFTLNDNKAKKTYKVGVAREFFA